MSMTRKQLEAAALHAHRDNSGWQAFWSQYGPHAVATEPHDRGRFHRLVRRLTAIVAAGDVDDQRPVDAGYGQPFDFELDGQAGAGVVPIIGDVTTAARCLWRPAAKK